MTIRQHAVLVGAVRVLRPHEVDPARVVERPREAHAVDPARERDGRRRRARLRHLRDEAVRERRSLEPGARGAELLVEIGGRIPDGLRADRRRDRPPGRRRRIRRRGQPRARRSRPPALRRDSRRRGPTEKLVACREGNGISKSRGRLPRRASPRRARDRGELESEFDARRLRPPPSPQSVLPARRRESPAGALPPRRASSACPRSRSPTTATCSARSTSTTRRSSTACARSSASRRTSRPADRRDREAQAASESGEGYAYHLTILAATQKGYRNLVRLVSEAYLTGFYHRPRMDKALLREHAEGLIGLSGCLKGEVAGALSRGNYGAAKKAFLEYEEIFGKGNFYVEIMDHGLPQQTAIVPGPAAALDGDRRAGRRDQRQPLPAPRRRLPARGPALHRHGQDARGRAADAVLQRRVLREGPGRDAGAVPPVERRGRDEHRRRRGALRRDVRHGRPAPADVHGAPTADRRPTTSATSRARGSSGGSPRSPRRSARPPRSRRRSTATGSSTRSASSRRWASRRTS